MSAMNQHKWKNTWVIGPIRPSGYSYDILQAVGLRDDGATFAVNWPNKRCNLPSIKKLNPEAAALHMLDRYLDHEVEESAG
jgi:hypothetical protein